jgi:signal transduction histidine kinase
MTERPKVLIVDDVEANLIAVEAVLTRLDCEPIRASSGNDALRHLLKNDFAVVLLDVQMPDMDGFEVARLARQNPSSRNVPIIFVTAMHETDENLFLGYESGAVDVLFKPVNAHILASKVQVFLELHRSRRKLAAEIEAHERTLLDLDAFNYSVSHDLRAPLRPIKGFIEIVLERNSATLDDEARSLLIRVGAAAERMNGLIDDLLRLSTIGRAQLSPSSVDLTKVVNDVFDDIRRNDPGRIVEVVVEPGMTIRGDGPLLRIALENLLRNAWKFTSKTDAARIEVRSQAGRDGTYFVRDNGAGFDSAYKAKLFKAFQRLHRSTDFEGTGIGLAIVQRVIQRHGGRVWADGEPDRGATFFFTLPGGNGLP